MSSIESSGIGSMQRSGPRDLFSRVDSDRSGGVSAAELQKLSAVVADKTGKTIDAGTEAFNSYDSDGNGSLSGEELRAVLDNSGFGPAQGMQGMAPPPPPPQQATDSYNANLSASEKDALSELVSKLQDLLDTLKSGAEPKSQGQVPGGAPQDIFGKADTDRNGSLSQDELEAFARALKESTGQTLDVSKDSIKSLDRNGDGQLSPDEVDLRKTLSLDSANLNGNPAAKGLKTALDQNWVQEQQATGGLQQDESVSNKQSAQTASGTVQNQIAELNKLLETVFKYYRQGNNESASGINITS